MREVCLDGVKMQTRQQAHEYLASELKLPEYYGNNLDALFDCLTEASGPLHIRVENTSALFENLGGYGKLLLRVMGDAAEANSRVSVDFIEQ